jgi:uracil-DNA glycosylase
VNGDEGPLTAWAAKKLAEGHLRGDGSPWAVVRATRNGRFGVWLVDYHDPARPGEVLAGGCLVVTDAGAVHSMGSVPGALDDLMMAVGLWPGKEPADVFADDPGDGYDGPVGTDAESLLLLADQDPAEAVDLTAYATAMRPWPGVLDEERDQPYFHDLCAFVKSERARGEVYPPQEQTFNAFRLTRFDQVKVVLLGQDPYPNPGQAMGLSFSVPSGVALPASLRNIHAAMRAEGLTPPPDGDLTGWAHQGVLLLNTALTVPRNDAGRHVSAWRPFTDAVIGRLNSREVPLVFVLWGAKAQRALRRGLIDASRHEVLTAPHPAARGQAQRRFQEAATFGRVNDALASLGRQPVDWAGL